MCLLVKQPSTTNFTDDFLTDVFQKNSDGFGVMYAEDEKLHVYKCLPATAQDFIDFYRTHAEGRDCVWHARMQTHGDIDFDNCHPYKVTENIWLAHNGVLSTGNDADRTRSDTWHFIRNVMAPALKANPELMKDEEWIDFIGQLIGRNNKFGLMDNLGNIALINEASGVEFVGAWLSNTYAWSTYKFGFQSAYQPNKNYTNMYGGSWYNKHAYEDEDFEGYGKVGKSYPVSTVDEVTEVKGEVVNGGFTSAQIKPFIRAAYNQFARQGLRGVEQWVLDAPYKAAALLAFWYDDIENIGDLVAESPEDAAEWITDLFETDSIAPSLYQ